MLGSVFVYANLICLLIRKDKILEEFILELCRCKEVLSIRSDLRFQTYQIKIETLAIDNAFQDIGKIGLAATSEENGESIFLLDAQFYKLDLGLSVYSTSTGSVPAHNCFIPPTFPGSWFFLFNSIASCAQDGRIMPPSAMSKAFVCLKITKRRSSPELWVG